MELVSDKTKVINRINFSTSDTDLRKICFKYKTNVKCQRLLPLLVSLKEGQGSGKVQ